MDLNDSRVKQDCIQGVTRRCRLSWLTNGAIVYEPKFGGGGELRGLSQWIQLSTWSPNKLWISNIVYLYDDCADLVKWFLLKQYHKVLRTRCLNLRILCEWFANSVLIFNDFKAKKCEESVLWATHMIFCYFTFIRKISPYIHYHFKAKKCEGLCILSWRDSNPGPFRQAS